MLIEALDVDGARGAWERSLELKPSGWALRNMSVLEARAGNKEAAFDLLQKAWYTGPRIAPLAIECAQLLIQMERYEELRQFALSLPDDVKQNERIALLSAKAALETGHLDEIEPLFTREFATIREGEVTLTDLWFSLHEHRIAESENAPIDENLRKRVKRDFPPPANIDFRMLRSQ
jgi:tetratricopeptide (TPR) repeat protein